MSATFKISKKKYTQSDLRRLMNEHKNRGKTPANLDKIDSALAKYNELGQLICVLCKSIVRSESVWKVHINSKQHKENIAAAKQLKDQLEASKSTLKRPVQPSHLLQSMVPLKRAKGDISTKDPNLKNLQMSADFFDINRGSCYFKATLEKTTIKKDLVNIRRDVDLEKREIPIQPMDLDEPKEGSLPEGFFDDPVKDAKIRNQDYKDPHGDEWEKFLREIKEETTLSSAIIAEEQDEATTERQIEEIDEQIRKWSRVLDLEKRKEVFATKFKTRCSSRIEMSRSDSESNAEDDTEMDEFLDWRAKRSDRKV